MANQWYYTKDEERMGPISADELKQMATSGEVLPDDLVWKEGMDDWRPASQLKGLFSDAPDAAPMAAGVSTVALSVPGVPSAAWQFPIICAAVVLITAMFVPWWSFRISGSSDDIENSVTPPFGGGRRRFAKSGPGMGRFGKPRRDDSKEKEMKRFGENFFASFGWYWRQFTSISVRAKIPDELGSDAKVNISGRIWGWNTSLGFAAAMIGFSILPISVVMMSSHGARRFGWVASLLMAYVGLVFSVLVLTWYIDCPGFDFKPHFYQGAHAGPYLGMAAGLLLLIFGLLDGILGLKAFNARKAVTHTPPD